MTLYLLGIIVPFNLHYLRFLHRCIVLIRIFSSVSIINVSDNHKSMYLSEVAKLNIYLKLLTDYEVISVYLRFNFKLRMVLFHEIALVKFRIPASVNSLQPRLILKFWILSFNSTMVARLFALLSERLFNQSPSLSSLILGFVFKAFDNYLIPLSVI
jgi:hypothetical protein